MFDSGSLRRGRFGVERLPSPQFFLCFSEFMRRVAGGGKVPTSLPAPSLTPGPVITPSGHFNDSTVHHERYVFPRGSLSKLANRFSSR